MLCARPAAPADVPSIFELVAACEVAAEGRVVSAPDGIAADLARPAIEPARDTVLLHTAGGELVAWGWVHLGRRVRGYVRPDQCGRGIGGRLLDWAEAVAHGQGSAGLGQDVSDRNPAARALLEKRGYRRTATSWELEIAMAAEPRVRPVPGIAIRAFQPGDETSVYEMLEAAFADWQQRPRPYAEWAAQTIARETFAPALSPLAFDGDRLVGAVLSLDRPASPEGYVLRVGVLREHRNRGIARALLASAFAGFHRTGRRVCTLWTHSETGALGLYERLGMSVRLSSGHYAKALTAPAEGLLKTAARTAA